MSSYFSFLLCFHLKQTDVYYTGIPIGQIIGGQFVPGKIAGIGGEPREIGINNLPHPCPFKDFEELKAAVIAAVQQIQVEEPSKTHENDQNA